jgi:ABC-type molybdate transport system ATPase subunit
MHPGSCRSITLRLCYRFAVIKAVYHYIVIENLQYKKTANKNQKFQEIVKILQYEKNARNAGRW